MKELKPSSQRLKLEDVRALAESKGFLLLDDFYINSKTKMNLKCEKGHVFQKSVDNLRKKCGCPKCQGLAKPMIEEIQEFMSQFQYTLLSEVYTNRSTKMSILCNNEHQYLASWSQFKRGQRCPYCSGNKKYELYEVKAYIEKNNYKLISTLYKGAHAKLEMICPNGHEYSCSFHNFLSGKRCSQCVKISKGEEEIKRILIQLGIPFEYQYIFEDCKRIFHLPFDFYLNELNIVIEYDGEQHFYPIDFAGKGEEWAEKEFLKVQERDAIKNQFCIDNHIELIRIPYYEFKNIENIITHTLKQKNLQRLSLERE